MDDTTKSDDLAEVEEPFTSTESDTDSEQSSAAEVTTGDADNAEDSDENLAGFAFLALALLVLVGASVYFVGTLLSSDQTTAEAEARAEAAIENFDTTPVPTEPAPETVPSTLQLPDETEPTPTTEAEFDETQAPFSNVNPEDIGIAFVNRTPGDQYGLVGYIDRNGERQMTELECDRLDLNANGGLCLDSDSGLAGSGRGLILNASLNPTLRFGINLPSRAAVSPDGEVVAWTGFALGHSYLDVGEFATTTQLIEVERGIGANLETAFAAFDLEGQQVDNPERNYWGVTFADSDTFYATLGIGPDTSIIEGSVSTSRIQVVHENATCPEISPDGSTLVVKELRDGDRFQLVAIDLASGARRDLGEVRSVEDQVEFLDNSTIIYGLPNEAEGTDAQPAWDVWALDLNGGSPQLIIPFADSPAAI